jgi:hypothetical protein
MIVAGAYFDCRLGVARQTALGESGATAFDLAEAAAEVTFQGPPVGEPADDRLPKIFRERIKDEESL